MKISGIDATIQGSLFKLGKRLFIFDTLLVTEGFRGLMTAYKIVKSLQDYKYLPFSSNFGVQYTKYILRR